MTQRMLSELWFTVHFTERPASAFIWAAFVVAVALVFLRLARLTVLSQVKHLPGPWYCHLSGLPLLYHAIRGDRPLWVHNLSTKYGDAVVVAPNRVALKAKDAINLLYGKGWRRAPFYDNVGLADRMHLLGISDATEASRRRRAIMPAFANSNLKELVPMIHNYISIFLQKIDQEQEKSGVVDLLRWYRLLAFDIVAQLAFDHKFDMLETGKEARIVELVHAGITSSVAKSLVPGLSLVIALIGTPSARTWMRAQKDLGIYGAALYREYLDKPAADRHSKSMASIHSHFGGTDTTPGLSQEIACETSALLIAGSDTTSMTLVYLTYELAKHTEWQKRLQDELDDVMSGADALPHTEDLSDLPFLNSVIKETLRFYPAVPGELPRVVPAEGAVINGVHLHAGTTAFCQPFTMNRLPTAFGSDSNEFNPTRFLNETVDMKTGLFSFSAGPRTCAGVNLAYVELRLLAAVMFRRYNIRLASDTTDHAMAPIESFFTAPRGFHCRVILSLRS